MTELRRLEEVSLVDERGGNLVLEVDVGGGPAALDDAGTDPIVGDGVVVADEGEEEAANLARRSGRRGEERVEYARRGGVAREGEDAVVAERVDAVGLQAVSSQFSW